MSSTDGGVTWRVDAQNQRQRVTAAGVIEDGYDVFFTTGNGHNGSVFVPASRYDRAHVLEAVAEAAARMEDIGSLTHESQV